MKTQEQKQTILQQQLTIFKCKNCNGEQLVSKPIPRRVVGGGVVVKKSKITCDFCSMDSMVTRYPNGSVVSRLLIDGK